MSHALKPPVGRKPATRESDPVFHGGGTGRYGSWATSLREATAVRLAPNRDAVTDHPGTYAGDRVCLDGV